MPPRYTYWTILLDGQPTAFRARTQEELLPTLNQLRSKNPAAIMKWFANGRLWESPEEARGARTRTPEPNERRGADWRPGGKHEDPRTRFIRAGRAERKPAPAPARQNSIEPARQGSAPQPPPRRILRAKKR